MYFNLTALAIFEEFDMLMNDPFDGWEAAPIQGFQLGVGPFGRRRHCFKATTSAPGSECSNSRS